MTFLEAAIEILRHEPEPLHFAEITKRAVERKLLSHVGRDPETAMQTCLNSAVRNNTYEGLLLRDKPGHFHLRPDADLPELAVDATESALPENGNDSGTSDHVSSKPSKVSVAAEATRGRRRPGKKAATRGPKVTGPDEFDDADHEDEHDDGDADPHGPAERRVAAVSAQLSESARREALPMPALDPSKIRFRGPEGSGLEGDTDIAVVMANAMSRVVVDRPELREELEAMQRPVPEVEVVRAKRREEPRRDERAREAPPALDEDRGGRRRRRRRRRSRRVDWTEGGQVRPASQGSEELLDKVAGILGEAGARSLHVRQISENLASQNVLGGEISEIERAVTAALLLDVHRRGDGSRFAVRGDARYQLRGSRVPDKAAQAEHAARRSLLQLEQESERQLLQWLQALGVRSLETVVRMWLDREEHTLLATLPPGRGLAKLIAEDPDVEDDDGRVLVLMVPRKTPLDPKQWEGEAERNGCGATLIFAMGEGGELGDARVIGAAELARWMIRQRIGVRMATFEVAVLDADLIESIAGLDT